MHKIRVSAVKTLETGKFNADTALYENPCKATIKWDKTIPLTEAGAYNNQEAVILTTAEYETLKEGFTGSISTEFADRLIGGLEALLNQLTNEKKVREE